MGSEEEEDGGGFDDGMLLLLKYSLTEERVIARKGEANGGTKF